MRARSLSLLLLVLLLTPALIPSPVYAAARVGVANDQGGAAVDPTYATSLRLSGSGFQSVQGGFGGIYVLFGTVSGSWRPSAGGGGSMLYVPDSQTSSNAGHQRFVAFPGSDTSGEANGGTLSRSGAWSTTLNVPGASFRAVDADGKVRSVDCRKVTCGVITIGAHGVGNRANETFTPVSVASLYDGEPPATGAPSQSAGQAAGGTGGASAAAAPQPTGTQGSAPSATPSGAPEQGARSSGRQPAVTPTLEVDRSSAAAGRVLAFTGTGLPAGRQVSAVLDDGESGAGPFTVAADGSLSGLLQLPADVSPGTHELRLVGVDDVTVRFAVASDVTQVAAEVGWQPRAFVAGAALALLVALLLVVRRLRRGARA